MVFSHTFNCVALIHPQKTNVQTWPHLRMLGGEYCRRVKSWKSFAHRESKKLFRSWGANASVRSELQVCIFALNNSVHFARDNVVSLNVPAALKHWDQTPALAGANSAVTSQYFRFSRDTPVLEILIQSCPYEWADLDGFQLFFQTWVFVQVLSVLQLFPITVDCTAFQWQPEQLLIWKLMLLWYLLSGVYKLGKESEQQVPSLVLEIIVDPVWQL